MFGPRHLRGVATLAERQLDIQRGDPLEIPRARVLPTFNPATQTIEPGGLPHERVCPACQWPRWDGRTDHPQSGRRFAPICTGVVPPE